MKNIFIIFSFILLSLCSGCATGFMTSYDYDPKADRAIKKVYSPLFASDSIPLAQGAEFRVSVVITRRVEPISYNFLALVGGLTSEDLESTATVVVHFKNDSAQRYRINLKKVDIVNKEFPIKISEILLRPGDRLDTKSVVVKAPTYDTDFTLNLYYEIEGKPASQVFAMKRERMEDLRRQENKERAIPVLTDCLIE